MPHTSTRVKTGTDRLHGGSGDATTISLMLVRPPSLRPTILYRACNPRVANVLSISWNMAGSLFGTRCISASPSRTRARAHAEPRVPRYTARVCVCVRARGRTQARRVNPARSAPIPTLDAAHTYIYAHRMYNDHVTDR